MTGSAVDSQRIRTRARFGVLLAINLLVACLLEGGLRAEFSLGAAIVTTILLAAISLTSAGPAALYRRRDFQILVVSFGLTLVAGLLPALLAWFWPGSRGSSLDPSATLVEVLLLAGMGCAFMLSALISSSRQAAVILLRLIVGVGVIIALWSLWLHFRSHDQRLTASFLAPNTAGAFFGALLVMAAGLFVQRVRQAFAGRGGWTTALWVVACVILGAALLQTVSRGAALSTAAGLAIALTPQLIAPRGRGRLALVALAVLVALLIGFTLFGGAVLDRLANSPDQQDSRGEIFALHWRLFLEQPVSGYGLGSFDALHRSHLDAESFRRLWSIRSAHNVYLQWLEEGGLIAALPMFFTVGALLWGSLRGALRAGPANPLLWALLGASAVFLIQGIADFALQTPAVATLFAVFLGIQFGLVERSQRRRRRSRPARWPDPLPVVAGLACALALTSLLVGGSLPVGPVKLFPLAAGMDRKATALIARSPSPGNLAQAEQLSRSAAALAPFDTSAMLRIAYIDTLRSGRLTKAGARQIEASYQAVAFDQAVALWRIRFCLEHWGDLPPSTRLSARREFEAMVRTRGHRQALLSMLEQVQSPSGAFTARFWSNKVLREPI